MWIFHLNIVEWKKQKQTDEECGWGGRKRVEYKHGFELFCIIGWRREQASNGGKNVAQEEAAASHMWCIAHGRSSIVVYKSEFPSRSAHFCCRCRGVTTVETITPSACSSFPPPPCFVVNSECEMHSVSSRCRPADCQNTWPTVATASASSAMRCTWICFLPVRQLPIPNSFPAKSTRCAGICRFAATPDSDFGPAARSDHTNDVE